jgi:hypothetical protein
LDRCMGIDSWHPTGRMEVRLLTTGLSEVPQVRRRNFNSFNTF